MGNYEYRLLDIAEDISPQAHVDLNEHVDNMMQQFNIPSSSEALQIGKFIYLPNSHTLAKPSYIKTKSIKRAKIDHIAELKHPEAQEALKKLHASNDLKQKEIRKIVNQVNKFQNQLSDDNRMLEELLKFLTDLTDSVVNEKQVEKYVKDLEKYTERIIHSIYLENPEVLPKEVKDEVISKVTFLKEHLDILIRDLSASEGLNR